MDESRKQFEALPEFASDPPWLQRQLDGKSYVYTRVQGMWEGWQAARSLTERSEWISVEDRMPPAATRLIAYGRSYGRRDADRMVYMTFISTRPLECVEDEEITHWQPLPPPPLASSPSGKPGGEG